VTDVAVTVYRVDLMKLYLLHRDLNQITRVNLAGIKPLVERTERLARARTYREEKRELRLPLRSKGAYLVVLKGKEAQASGMVLVSDLELEVKEDALAGRVRVHVLDRRTQKPVRKVFVRVVGSGDGRFQGALTDLRGVFAADGVSGRPTVIAARADSYAFYRGVATVVPRPDVPSASPAAAPAKPMEGLQQELERRNLGIQKKARDAYEQQLRNEEKGVQVDKLK
jgi:hypothetical protein